jgi:hypothetical protein
MVVVKGDFRINSRLETDCNQTAMAYHRSDTHVCIVRGLNGCPFAKRACTQPTTLTAEINNLSSTFD